MCHVLGGFFRPEDKFWGVIFGKKTTDFALSLWKGNSLGYRVSSNSKTFGSLPKLFEWCANFGIWFFAKINLGCDLRRQNGTPSSSAF